MDTYWNEHLEGRIARLLAAGERAVLLTIIASSGSTPRHTGTRALLSQQGFEGTLGGGLLEAQSIEAARGALAAGRPCRAFFDLAGQTADSDMICGGGMEVLCEMLTPEQAPLFARACGLLDANEGFAAWQVRINGAGGNIRVSRQLMVGNEAEALFAGRKVRPCLLPQGGVAGSEAVYLEPLAAPPVLLLVGGGHVSLCVAQLAHACDFVVDVVDDREEFANSQRFPMARRCLALPRYENLAQACAIGPRHYVAIMTRGHAFDRETLAQALPARPRYLGMIGSRTKRDKIYGFLREEGVSDAALQRVRCPIGLGIEAETPQQIAVSVVSELLAERKGTLDALRSISCR